MTHSDELDALRDAFQSLPLPETTPPLSDADAQTQQVVDWMRAAAAALPVPDTAPPTELFTELSGEHPAGVHLVGAPQVDTHSPGSHPVSSVPRGTRRSRSSRASRQWMRHAAAVLIFAGLASLLQFGRQAETPWHSPLADSATTDTDIGASTGIDRGDPTEIIETHPPIPGFRAAPKTGTGLLATADGQLELRSGPVRLVLLTANFALDPAAPPR